MKGTKKWRDRERKGGKRNFHFLLVLQYRGKKKNEADLEAMAKVDISRPPGPSARGLT